MKISKSVKILIGLLTVFSVLFPFLIGPLFSMIFMLGFGLPFFDFHSAPNPNDFKALIPFMMVFYPFMMCFSFVQLDLQIFYVIHEIKNKVLTDTVRILLTIGTFFLPYITMPIYFFVYLWKDNPQDPQALQA